MDFHGLPRKELQTLCKKNKIPANMTNIAMADALAALTNVEGIEEIGRPETACEKLQPVSDSPYTCGRASTRRRAGKDQVVLIENEQENSRTRGRPRKIIQDDEQEAKDSKDLSEDSSVPVPESPCTALRSSTRRRPVSRNADVSIENNLESSKPLTRTRCQRRRVKEEQVDKDLGDLVENPSGEANPTTPATRNGRRRTGASAVKVNETNKKEDEEEEDKKDEKMRQDLVVTRVYSTRRSARLQPKMADADLKTGRRIKAVQIASLTEEENEEPAKKSAPVQDEIEHVSGHNAKILDLDSCDSDVCALQEDLAPKDTSAIVIPVEDSSSDASNVPEQSTCEEQSIVENLIADQIEEDSATEISGITDLAPDQMMMLENPHCLETEESNLGAPIVNEADLVSEQLTVEKTHNLQDNESEADDSNAYEDYLIEEDASAPVISAEALHKNVEPAIERSENVKFECTDVEGPESQVIGKAELYDVASCEFPSSDGETLRAELRFGDEISEESLYKDLEFLHCKSSDKQMVISENTEQSSCLSKDLKLENEELNNGNIDACVDPDEDVERTGDFKGGDIEELGFHADGSGEIPPSLSEIWDFGLMKDSIQECLNGLESKKCHSDSIPLDIEVLGKVESGQEEPSHLDFNSTEITGWLNCQSPEEAESIKEPLDEKMVAPESHGLVSKPDAAMKLSFLPDDEMKTQKFGQIEDVIGDADSIATAKILCSDESRIEECDKGLSDEITVSSAAVPSFLSPCRGLISESGYHLNQIKVTPSKSSTKKKAATPSQRKALIMVLDENKENKGNYSGGMSLRKKSNSRVLASAADEKENIGNYSGGLRNKSNSKIIALVAEEKEGKENYSGGLSLRNKSNSKVTISVAEEKENNNKFEDSIQRTLKKYSLRQLKKMFKEQLLIADNNDGDNKKNDAVKEQQQVEKTRAALQTLTDNNSSLVGNREN